jgi:hypothetical protein
VRRVLRLPAYRRLLAAYALNELAWSVGTLALAVLVYRHTGSAVGAAAFFLCAQFFPALLSPALVARIDQRAPQRVLPSLYGLEAILFAALAFAASRFSLAPVLALALLDGVIAVTARALARAATVAVLTPVGLLREGNALTNTLFSICFMGGPALGGLVVATGGTIAALLVNSGLFATTGLILVTAGALPRAPQDHRVEGRVRAAIAHVRNDPVLRALLGIQTAALVLFTISMPVEVVFAQRSLHAGAGGYGALLSAWGAGAVAGSAAYVRWHGLPARGLIAASAAALGVGFLVMAAAPSLAVAMIGSAIGGVGNGIESVAARTAVQEQTPERWMALVMSLTESLNQAAPGGGIVLGGVIAALAGPRVALMVAGAGSLVVTLAIWLVLRPRAGFGVSSGASGSGPDSAQGTRPPSAPRSGTLA